MCTKRLKMPDSIYVPGKAVALLAYVALGAGPAGAGLRHALAPLALLPGAAGGLAGGRLAHEGVQGAGLAQRAVATFQRRQGGGVAVVRPGPGLAVGGGPIDCCTVECHTVP